MHYELFLHYLINFIDHNLINFIVEVPDIREREN